MLLSDFNLIKLVVTLVCAVGFLVMFRHAVESLIYLKKGYGLIDWSGNWLTEWLFWDRFFWDDLIVPKKVRFQDRLHLLIHCLGIFCLAGVIVYIMILIWI
jgi:hypothetical protein